MLAAGGGDGGGVTDGVSNVLVDPDKLASDLLALCIKPVEEVVDGDGLSYADCQRLLAAVFEDLNSFVCNTAHLPPMAHTEFSDMMRAVATLAKDSMEPDMDMATLAGIIGKEVPFEWYEAASTVSAVAIESGRIPAAASPIFPSMSALEDFLRLRSGYVVMLLNAVRDMNALDDRLLAGLPMMVTAFLTDRSRLADPAFKTFIGLEASAATLESWQDLWNKVLACSSIPEFTKLVMTMKQQINQQVQQTEQAASATQPQPQPLPLADDAASGATGLLQMHGSCGSGGGGTTGEAIAAADAGADAADAAMAHAAMDVEEQTTAAA